MSKEEIIEGNKLIAEFMGGKVAYFNVTNFMHYRNLSHGRTILPEDLKFHSSWDWLMPVVEKIESMGNHVVTISLYSCSISEIALLFKDSHVHIESDSDSKIEAVYVAVIEFINWYNKNKTT